MKTGTLLIVLAGLLGPAARAAAPRFIEPTPVPATDSNFVERVTVPGAACAAVSETGQVLAVSHVAGAPVHLTLFRLDDAGRVLTNVPPQTITLPKPASLAAYTNVVTALAAHPTQPLLYVLQDLYTSQQPPLGDPKTNPVLNGLDRLFVYRLGPTNIEQVAVVRGPSFFYGMFVDPRMQDTPIGLDAVNRRLYLPNLRDPEVTNELRTAIGYLELDDQGLPVATNGNVNPPRIQYSYGAGAPTGYGWMPVSRDVVLFGWYAGVATWDMSNRRAPITLRSCNPDYGAQIAGHPTLPVVYRTATYSGKIMALELVDGFPTMFPQELTLAYCWQPQVLAKRQQLAVGCQNQLVLIDLDANGKLTAKMTTIAVASFDAHAYCYSPKFDRLYVAGGKVP